MQYKSLQKNAAWLAWLAPFRGLTTSSAFVAPFFLGHGMNQLEIFVLQSIFSAAYVLCELPGGWLADRWGRTVAIRLSGPLCALGLLAYSVSSEFWQFVLCELMLAVGGALFSGADKALLYDSLKATGQLEQFSKLNQRRNGLGFLSVAVGGVLAIPLVHQFGIGATLLTDGFLTMLGVPFAWLLAEPPRGVRAPKARRSFKQRLRAVRESWQVLRQPLAHTEVRWLIVFTTALGTATYLSAWLTAKYLQEIAVPVFLFGGILAARNVFKAFLSHKVHATPRFMAAMMVAFVAFIALGYAGMASLWLVAGLLLLGHDAVHALHDSPITKRLNEHVDDSYRATFNSFVSLVERTAYTVLGPLAGWLTDAAGLRTALLAIGTLMTVAAGTALARLLALGTFGKKE